MYLKELNLKDFRNYESACLRFDRGVNYVIGENAQGKSNLIEAVYYLSTGRSFRTNRVANLVHWSRRAFRLGATVGEGESTTSVDLSYSGDGVSLTIDGRRARKMGDLIGILNTIIFCPEDLYIVKGSPYLRRRFIDILISQLYRPYLVGLARYGRVLRQRNEAIRRGGRDLYHWDRQLLECGLEVMKVRARYIERLGTEGRAAYSRIRPGEMLDLAYDSLYSKIQVAQEGGYREAMMSVRDAEVQRGTTLVGPHRDDIVITIDGRDARYFASDGQRRAVIIALKSAQFVLAREVQGSIPVLLIDDPLAELDIEKRAAVMPFLSNGVQCIITSIGEEGLLRGKRFRVDGGRAEEIA